MTVKEEYEKLKLDLPDFSVLDFEFELSTLEDEQFLLREVVKRCEERISSVLNLLSNVLQPDAGSFTQLYECAYFSQQEKEKVAELFKRGMILQRGLLLAEVSLDDGECGHVLNHVAKDWPSIRKEAAGVLAKLRECWEQPSETKEILGYFG